MTDEEKIEKRKHIAVIAGTIAEVLTGIAVSVAVKNVLDAALPDYIQYGKFGKVIKIITVAGVGGLSGAAVGSYYKDQIITGAEVINDISSLIKSIKNKNDEVSEDNKDTRDCNKEETSFA